MRKNTFSLHGLWPGLLSGELLPACTTGIVIEPDESPLYKTMDKEWPSFSHANADFWGHEYNKHGFCYSERTHTSSSPKPYFQKTLDVFHSKAYADIYNKLKPSPNLNQYQ